MFVTDPELPVPKMLCQIAGAEYTPGLYDEWLVR